MATKTKADNSSKSVEEVSNPFVGHAIINKFATKSVKASGKSGKYMVASAEYQHNALDILLTGNNAEPVNSEIATNRDKIQIEWVDGGLKDKARHHYKFKVIGIDKNGVYCFEVTVFQTLTKADHVVISLLISHAIARLRNNDDKLKFMIDGQRNTFHPQFVQEFAKNGSLHGRDYFPQTPFNWPPEDRSTYDKDDNLVGQTVTVYNRDEIKLNGFDKRLPELPIGEIVKRDANENVPIGGGDGASDDDDDSSESASDSKDRMFSTFECPSDKEHSKDANDYFGIRKNAKTTKKQIEAFKNRGMPKCFDCDTDLMIHDEIVKEV